MRTLKEIVTTIRGGYPMTAHGQDEAILDVMNRDWPIPVKEQAIDMITGAERKAAMVEYSEIEMDEA